MELCSILCNSLWEKNLKNVCIYISDLLCWTLETNTVLQIGSTPIKIFLNSKPPFFFLFMEKRPHSQMYVSCVCVSGCCSVMSNFLRLFVACQSPLSMEFSRQEYWNGLPFPSQGIFLNQGWNPGLQHCRKILYPLSHQGRTNVGMSSVGFKELMVS